MLKLNSSKYVALLDKVSPAHLIGFSATVACWVIFMQRGWVTEDSILYYEMARLISLGDFQSAYAMYSWPLYPALIALTHKITSLSFQHSGNLLSVLFFTITTWALTQIVARLGGSVRAQLLSIVILLSSRYIVGDIMPMSTRDQGYWAMMSLAIWQFIVLHQQGQLRAATLWQVFAMMGTLFRIEGVVLLMALPWVIFILPQRNLKQKQTAFFWSFCLLIAGLITGLIVLVLLQVTGLAHIEIAQFGRVKELFTGFGDIANNINQNLVHRADVMRDEVIGEPFKEFAWFTFLLSLFSISVVKCIFVAGWTPAILTTAYARSSKSLFETDALRILVAVLFITWVTGCLIIFKVNILSGRYVVVFGLSLVAISAVILDDQLKRWSAQSLKQKSLICVCGLIVLIGLIGNIWPKQAGYAHERDAVLYVKSQLKPAQKALYTTTRQRFYADATYEGRDYDDWQYLTMRIENGRVNDYVYLVIHLDIKPETAEKEAYLSSHLSQFKLNKTFYGYKKKKRILVFKKALS